MSFLRSISELFFGGSSDSTDIVLEGGQFYRSGGGTPKVCLFPYSNLSIQKTSIESQYLLLVTRVVDEGEELEDDDEFELSFLIDSSLKVQWSTVFDDIHSEKSTAKILSTKGTSFNFYFTVGPTEEPSTQFVGLDIEEMREYKFNERERSFVWVNAKNKLFYAWSVNFEDDKSYNEFKSQFGIAFFESKLQMDFSATDSNTQSYVSRAYTENYPVKGDDEDISDDVEDYGGESEPEYDDPRDDVKYDPMETDKDFNRHMAVAYKSDRSFVIRGSRIGVFKKDQEENDMKYETKINKITDSNNKDIDVSQMMLHNQDKSLILRDDRNKETIYMMDIETGKIVEEYDSECFPCTFTFHNSKYNQVNPDQTFLGLNRSSMFQVDPRVNGKEKIVMDNFKQYSAKTLFTCASTTQDGRFAVANEMGEIRLYNKLGKNSKTALPALGDKIYGLDISNDGRYILATCATYLLVVDTLIHSDSNNKTGFDKSFPKGEQPKPLCLKLKPEHTATIQDPIHFTHAKFNYGPDSNERYIVTSTSQYVVVWTFSKVKQGKVNSYKIAKFSDNIVADNFWFNDDSSIVVTLPHDVTIAQKSKRV
ncbi:VID27-domain-containing protein [Conidiobolus coronatus NRRL 28638]|uniref:VID27-domain-containing protein n=1 Tax=Conidiobolus coronatus (strain ATCC 28846 / CBS 209.66 / NRRL 28638) TaxID=796925 RepID=A0A137PD74_CONC2|nr:VID27-domain-containing protein [Conidiobolus coronatus NRRL 28638]|eukprot:KXN72922.1 VID27-domain-containing protein [Conidiobolus coronatus NRRL 28638]